MIVPSLRPHNLKASHDLNITCTTIIGCCYIPQIYGKDFNCDSPHLRNKIIHRG